jgi:hypothetical protein
MINSRLYYDINELPAGILRFHYYTDEISANFTDLKTYTKQINQQEVLPALYKIGIQNMLYNINEVEFSKLVKEIEKYTDYINDLEGTYPMEANIAIAKLWGPNELQRKFIQWFEKNGYPIPNGK